MQTAVKVDEYNLAIRIVSNMTHFGPGVCSFNRSSRAVHLLCLLQTGKGKIIADHTTLQAQVKSQEGAFVGIKARLPV